MKEYKITSFLDRERSLLFTADYLEYEHGDVKGKEFTRINKADVADFKHGAEWIVWYKFTIGRKFSISFKDKNNKELRILFNSYFGLRKEHILQYSEIIEDIWKFYQADIVNTYLEKFYKNKEIEIQGIKLTAAGIHWKGQNTIIDWDSANIKEYYGYFAVCHRDDPGIHARVSFNEYGAETLWSMIKAIVKEKQMTAPEPGK